MGWSQPAEWMRNPALADSLNAIVARPTASRRVLDAGSYFAMDGNPGPDAGPEEGSPEDKALVQEVLADGEVGQVLDAGEAGSVLVLPEDPLSSWTGLYLQPGLQPPADLPESVAVRNLPKTLEGVLDVLRNAMVQDSDVVVLNANFVDEQEASQWIPPWTTKPGLVRITPEQAASATARNLAAAGSWSRLLGQVVDYGSLTVTYVPVGETTYAVIRSA